MEVLDRCRRPLSRRRVAASFLSALLLLHLLLLSVPSSAESLQLRSKHASHWALLQDAGPGAPPDADTATTSLHFFFPLRAAAATSNSSSRGGSDREAEELPHETSINARLAAAHARRAPEAGALTRLVKWLNDPSCVALWDHVRCTALPVRRVEHLFGCRMVPMVRRRRRGSVKSNGAEGQQPAVVHWLAQDLATMDELRQRIAANGRHLHSSSTNSTNAAAAAAAARLWDRLLVFGVLPFNPERQAPRRHRQRRQPGRRSMETSEAASAMSGSVEENTSDWAVDATTNTPVLISMSTVGDAIHSALIALKCLAVDHAQWGTTNPPAEVSANESSWQCPEGTRAPTAAQVVLIDTTSHRLKNVFNTSGREPFRASPWIELNTSSCAAAASAASWGAPPLVPATSVLAATVVCRLDLTSPGLANFSTGLPLWKRFTPGVAVRFGDVGEGASPPPLVSDYAVLNNFWQGATFTEPASYSADGGVMSFVSFRPVTPADIRELYAVPAPWPRAHRPGGSADVAQGAVEFVSVDEPGRGLKVSDLDAFMATLGIEEYRRGDLVIIGSANDVPQEETTLDLQLLMGISPGVTTYMYAVRYGGGTGCAEYDCAFLKFLSDIASPSGAVSAKPASVWSISYGSSEEDLALAAFEDRFALLSSSGVSIVASSGDYGAGWSESEPLISEFPASAPSVVGVGGTAMLRRRAEEEHVGPLRDLVEEVVCSAVDSNVITSGGGFSTGYSLPPSQRVAVEAYTTAHRAALEARGVDRALIDRQFPPGARGVPDVAAIAANIFTVIDGSEIPMYGTSASAPVIAAILTRFNLERRARDLVSLPRAVEFFYAAAANSSDAFVDVARGSNCAMIKESAFSPSGVLFSFNDSRCFTADGGGLGWDPTTGLGVVNYTDLLSTAVAWEPSPAPPPSAPSSPFSRPDSAKVAGIVLACCVASAVLAVAILVFLTNRKGPMRHAAPNVDEPDADYVRFAQ